MIGLGIGIQYPRSKPLGGVAVPFNGLFNEFPNGALGVSVRLLDSNYSGGLIRGRAWDGSIDQGQADIMPYQIGNEKWISLDSPLENLDSKAILRGLTNSHVFADLVDSDGVNPYDALVPKWYGQTVNINNDAVQGSATMQPKVVSGGNLLLQDGKPTIEFDGIDDGLNFTSTGYNIDNLSSYVLGKYNVLATTMMFAFSGFSGNARWYMPFGNNAGYANTTAAIPFTNNTNRNLFTMISGADLGNTSTWVNGGLQGTIQRQSIITSNENGIGNFNSGINADCNVQEVLVWGRDTSTNRPAIKANIDNAFPTL